jgi:Trk K+ transport system NAD-binding subunit
VIALVDDLARSRFLSYAGASRIISPKTLLGTFIAQIASPPKRHIFPGAIQLFGELKLAELPIYPGSELIGQSLQAESVTGTGASIVAIWQRGSFIPSPGRDEVIRANSILMAVGDVDQLSMIRDLTVGKRREGHLIVVGYGDVGRRVVRVLCENGIQPVIVDRRELPESRFRQVTGDGTLEATMVEAGIREAVGVLIMLNRDSDVIYSTLLAKNLNPDAFVVARANHVRSAEKIYRAGADYVGSVPLIAGHMLAKIVQEEEEELALLYEDLELKRFAVEKGSGMAGRSLEQIDLPGRFGCSVAAVDRAGQAITAIGPGFVLEMGDVLAIIGGPRRIEAFSRAYDRGLSFRR